MKVRDGSARRASARHPDEAEPGKEHDVGLRLVYGGQGECFTLDGSGSRRARTAGCNADIEQQNAVVSRVERAEALIDHSSPATAEVGEIVGCQGIRQGKCEPTVKVRSVSLSRFAGARNFGVTVTLPVSRTISGWYQLKNRVSETTVG